MRILHTSDWHIGKRLMGRERLKEQSAVLDEIVQICDREEVELVLIAGDIFDTYLPSAEAEDLFFTKIKAVAGKERAVVLMTTAFGYRRPLRCRRNSASISSGI